MAAVVTRARAAPLWGLFALLLAALPVAAQDRWDPPRDHPDTVPRHLDVNVSVGGLYSTDWSDLVLVGTVGGTTGAFQQVLLRDLSVDPAEAVSLGVTYWEGRLGFRTTAGFSRSCLAVGAGCRLPDPPADAERGDAFLPPEEEVNINTWTVDVAGMIRLRDLEGPHGWAPYVTLGAGGVVYDPDVEIAGLLPQFVDAPRQEPVDDEHLRVIVDDTHAFMIGMDEVGLTTRWAWLAGIGTDLRIPLGDGGLGLRVELTSHTVRSPLRFRILPLDGDETPGADGFRELDFGSVHNLRLTAGVVADVPLGFTVRGR